MRDSILESASAATFRLLRIVSCRGLTRLPLWSWEDTSILPELYACLSECIHHRSDVATLPAHLLIVERLKSDNGGDVNLGESCEFGLIESG